MNLKQWHDNFTAWVTQGNDTLAKSIVESDGFTKQERLNVYRNNCQQATISALRQTYELCNRCVGEDYFNQLARHYLEQYPPKQADLHQYGEHFADYLEQLLLQREELQALHYLPDLARLDWLCYQVYYAANAQPWPAESFNVLTPEQQAEAILVLSPHCFLLKSHWNLMPLWQSLTDQQEAVELEHSEQGYFWIVQRKVYQAELIELKESVYLALKSVQEGTALSELALLFPTVVSELPEWIAHGWIDNFRVNTKVDDLCLNAVNSKNSTNTVLR